MDKSKLEEANRLQNKIENLKIEITHISNFEIEGLMLVTNQWFNKTKAKWMSFVGDKGISKRLKRLICYRNLWINADINGSIGIVRKVFGDSAVQQIIGSGLAFNPIRVNVL